ncbi:MAG TPA: outer membrane beta-barrel protein [Sedimentisphaerales bacterium]|nr:outer membrane beta-barrel protein [Sedimentisphaerales bacterium]
MRTSSVVLTLPALCLLVCLPAAVQGRGLLGERYVDVLFGRTMVNDPAIEPIDDTISILGADLNWPISERLDLHAEISREELNGSDWFDVDIKATTVLGGVTYHFRPDQKTNPFILGRMGVTHSEIGRSNWSMEGDSSETGVAIALGGGVEFGASEDFSVRPSLTYQRVDLDIGNADDIVLGADANYWLTRHVFALGGLGIALEHRDITFFVGLGVGF